MTLFKFNATTINTFFPEHMSLWNSYLILLILRIFIAMFLFLLMCSHESVREQLSDILDKPSQYYFETGNFVSKNMYIALIYVSPNKLWSYSKFWINDWLTRKTCIVNETVRSVNLCWLSWKGRIMDITTKYKSIKLTHETQKRYEIFLILSLF